MTSMLASLLEASNDNAAGAQPGDLGTAEGYWETVRDKIEAALLAGSGKPEA